MKSKEDLNNEKETTSYMLKDFFDKNTGVVFIIMSVITTLFWAVFNFLISSKTLYVFGFPIDVLYSTYLIGFLAIGYFILGVLIVLLKWKNS